MSRKNRRCHCTPAETLIDLAEELYYPKDVIIVAYPGMPDIAMSRVHLAVEFKKRGPAFALRAMVERWSWRRIIREMY